jgi:hypothetical protein
MPVQLFRGTAREEIERKLTRGAGRWERFKQLLKGA